MPGPVISEVTGLFLFQKDKAIDDFYPTATNAPTSWAATGLPTGLSITAGTGKISGTPTAAGRFSVSLVATNGSGDSAPLKFNMKVVDPPLDEEGLIELNMDLQTGEITNPSITEGPQTYGKDGNAIGFALGLVRSGVLRTLDLTNVKVSLRDDYNRPLATLFDAAPGAPLDPLSPRYRVLFDLDQDEIREAVEAHAKDSKNPQINGRDYELGAKCEIELTYTISAIGGVTECIRTSKTFAVHLAKSLASA